MEIEEFEVDVPVNGLRVDLEKGKYKLSHTIHADTDAPNRVMISDSSMTGFYLSVWFKPPNKEMAWVETLKDVDGNDVRIPRSGLVELPEERVAARVRIKIYEAT